jgi:hypothetical protein
MTGVGLVEVNLMLICRPLAGSLAAKKGNFGFHGFEVPKLSWANRISLATTMT